MLENPDIKKALEIIAGHELTTEEIQRINFFLRTATWDRTDKPGEGFVTSKHLLIDFKSCADIPLLDVSGVGNSGSGGKVQLRLTDFICLHGVVMEAPINIVATAQSDLPVFATVLHTLEMDTTGNSGIDVIFAVYTWDTNGELAPNIAFDWRCRVGFREQIF